MEELDIYLLLYVLLYVYLFLFSILLFRFKDNSSLNVPTIMSFQPRKNTRYGYLYKQGGYVGNIWLFMSSLFDNCINDFD